MNLLLLASHDPLDHVLPHRFGDPIFHWPWTWKAPLNIFEITPHDTYFTNQMLMTLVAAGLLLLIFPVIGRRYKAMMAQGPDATIPRGFTNLIESVLQFIRKDVARPVLGDKTDRFIPFLWTLFFYILFCNLLGMIPLDPIIYFASGFHLKHIGGTATGNIMITAGLAACAFIMIHLSGARQVFIELKAGTYGHHHHDDEEHGHGGHHARGDATAVAAIKAPILYVWNFAPHVFAPEKVTGVGSLLALVLDFVMWAFLLFLEAIGAIIKPFALAIRLFANMVAGHVVLASLLALIFTFKGGVAANTGVGIIAAVGSAALSCLELFVAFLQAYVFVFLTTLFISMSVAPEH